MADKLEAAGFAAGLSPAAQKRLKEYSKSLSVHQTLVKMPQDAAQAKYNKLTPEQQANLQQNFGNEDPTTAPQRNPLQTAWHYTGGAVALFPYKHPIKAYVQGKSLPWTIPEWNPATE